MHTRPSSTRNKRPERGRKYTVARLAQWVLPALLVLAGCASPDAVRDEIRRSRSEDARQWLAEADRDHAASPAISGRLTLEDAVKLALQCNKELQGTLKEKEIAQGRTLEAKAKALPVVTAGAHYAHLDESPQVAFGTQSFDLAVADSFSAQLEVKQPLYAGGAIRSALRAASLGTALSDQRIGEQVEKTIFAVASTYYDTLLAEHLYEVNRDAVSSAKAHLNDVQQHQKQGTASDYDVLRSEVEVSSFQAEMIRQRNRIARAKISLLKTLGVSQKKELELADDLAYQPVPTQWPAAAQAALENRPELSEAELAIRLQQEALQTAQSAYRPRISASLAGTEGNPAPHTPTESEWGAGWTAGVMAEWPIFDLGRDGKVAGEKARLGQKKDQLADVRENVLLEVQQALLEIKDANELVDSQKMNLDRAAESLRLAELGYRQGLQSQLEVTDARAAVTRTRGMYYQALYDHCMARLNLDRAMGLLGIQIVHSAKTPPQPK